MNQITKISIYRFFDDFVIIYTLYTLLFQSSGLDVAQISILLATWSVTCFILEVPSGVLADKYDRKTILILAQLLRIFGFGLWYLVPTFWGFLFGFVLWGIKSALTSGTLEAYVYDGLQAEGEERKYAKVLGKLKAVSLIAILLSSALASTLFFLGYQPILLLSIASLGVSILALATAQSNKIMKSTEEVTYFKLLLEGISYVFKNYSLLILVLISSVLVGTMAIEEYFALYVDQLHISLSLVGYLFAAYSLLQTLAALAAHKFESPKLLFPILVVFSSLILLLSFAHSYAGVVVFMLLAFIASVGQVLSNTAMHKATKSHVRATVSSVSGFLAELLAFTVCLVFLFLPSGQIKQGLFIYGCIVTVLTVGIVLLAIVKKRTIYH